MKMKMKNTREWVTSVSRLVVKLRLVNGELVHIGKHSSKRVQQIASRMSSKLGLGE